MLEITKEISVGGTECAAGKFFVRIIKRIGICIARSPGESAWRHKRLDAETR